jgi:hypothetical protein
MCQVSFCRNSSVGCTLQGILIEASPSHFGGMAAARPAATCVHAAVCNTTSTVHYADAGDDIVTLRMHDTCFCCKLCACLPGGAIFATSTWLTIRMTCKRTCPLWPAGAVGGIVEFMNHSFRHRWNISVDGHPAVPCFPLRCAPCRASGPLTAAPAVRSERRPCMRASQIVRVWRPVLQNLCSACDGLVSSSSRCVQSLLTWHNRIWRGICVQGYIDTPWGAEY